MKSKLLALCAVLVLVGCGGGGGSSSGQTPETGEEFAFGSLVGRAAATNPPLTTTSANVAATGLTGTITALRLVDQEVLPSEQRIIFETRFNSTSGNTDIFACNLDGTDLVQVTSTPGSNESFAVPSPDGKRVAFNAIGAGGDLEIFVMNIDGTNRVQLTNNGINDSNPRWHPSGNLITYHDDNAAIQVINVNTKSVTTIVDDEFSNLGPCFTADGQTIAFHSHNREGDARYHLYKAPVVAGAPITFHYINGPSDQMHVRFAPDGWHYSFMDFGVGNQLYRPFSGSSVNGPDALSVEFSPDSKRVVYHRPDGSENHLFISNPDGSNEVKILGEITSSKFNPAFIPAPKEVVFVGSGSLFGSRLAGMIFSQSGSTLRGLLGFDANTPSTAVLTKQTDSDTDSPNLIFSIDADVVREISYAHAPYWKPIKVVGGGTSIANASGALVSINSATGRVVAVLPFTGSRSGRPTFRNEGNTTVFTGNFLGAFDKSGKNVAGGAVSEVRLNSQTGKLE